MSLELSLSMATAAQPSLDVEVVDARDVSDAVRQAWRRLRRADPALWSPHFDIRTFDILAKYAHKPHVLLGYQGGEIVAIFPFQGSKTGLIRPLGAPMSDQHGLICAQHTGLTLKALLGQAKASGLIYSGMLTPVEGSLNVEAAQCYVADLSCGLDAYKAWQKANWNDQVKKNARRIRQGEATWGPMRIETACPKSSDHFETLLAWKQAKYVETNRHNVLGVDWIQNCLRDFYRSPDPDFAGEVTCLFFGDHLAALEFGLRADKAMHSWFPAFDRTYAQVSPGILLMDGMIEACAQRGITKIDLGMGHAQYKRHASNAPITVYGGTYLHSPLRRAGTRALQALSDFSESHLKGASASFLSRFQRRQEMILASEPTATGRVKGYIAALKSIGTEAS